MMKLKMRIPTQQYRVGLDGPPKANVWNNGDDPCSWDSVSSTICAADQREPQSVRRGSSEGRSPSGVFVFCASVTSTAIVNNPSGRFMQKIFPPLIGAENVSGAAQRRQMKPLCRRLDR